MNCPACGVPLKDPVPRACPRCHYAIPNANGLHVAIALFAFIFIGCPSGILSLAAYSLGAEWVPFVEVDRTQAGLVVVVGAAVFFILLFVLIRIAQKNKNFKGGGNY